MADTIRFVAEVVKIQTMVKDYAIRLTFDLPETAIDIAALLMECKRRGAVLEIAAVPIEPEKQAKSRDNGEVPARSEWKP